MIPDLNRRLAEACAGTYQPGAIPQWEDDLKLVHVHLSMIDGVHCVAWQGTSNFQEWLVDFVAVEVPFAGHAELGPVHLGFMRDVLSVAYKIAAYFESLGWPDYYNTGHSKGAGEALLFHAEMLRRGHPPVATRAFEAPRVGSSILRDYLADEDIQQTATWNIHGADIVTQVPFGPTWLDVREPKILTVSNDYDVPTKHRIAAVHAALLAI